MVVPQRELLTEVLRYFINLKIIDRKASISLSYSECQKGLSRNIVHRYKCQSDKIDKLCDILERPSTQSFVLSTRCIHPEKLYHQVCKDLYNLSKTRPGAEDRVYNYQNPTVSPLYSGPDLGVSLEISFGDQEETVDNYEPTGLVFNKNTLINNMRGSHFIIDFECGPGFIYEYAAYITSKIAERFPEIGIDGGIDCNGGFIDGCTYACSLYAYERITITTANIADAIHRLFQEDIILPQKRAGKYGHEILRCENLYLFNLYYYSEDWKNKIIQGIVSGKTEFTPDEYEHFVRKVAETARFDLVDFIHCCTCCFKMGENIGALTCIQEDGQIWLEFRVASEIRDEFEKKLRLCGLAVK